MWFRKKEVEKPLEVGEPILEIAQKVQERPYMFDMQEDCRGFIAISDNILTFTACGAQSNFAFEWGSAGYVKHLNRMVFAYDWKTRFNLTPDEKLYFHVYVYQAFLDYEEQLRKEKDLTIRQTYCERYGV